MYINEPYLKGTSKRTKTTAKSINEYQFSKLPDQKNNKKQQTNQIKNTDKSRVDRPSQVPSLGNTRDHGRSKNRVDLSDFGSEKEFESSLMDDLQKLIKKWEDDLIVIENDLRYYEHSKESQSQIKAFQHCVNLLDAEYNQAQSIHDGSNNLINKKILQIDDYKLRILKEIKDIKEENRQLAKHKEKYAQQEKQREKKAMNKKGMNERLNQEKQKMERVRNSLTACKQKSYEQKNQFIEIQSQQFRLQNQIRTLEQQQQKYEEQIIQINKFNQLSKIKAKAKQTLLTIEDQVKPHLQRKIQKMAMLRSELNNIDTVLQSCLMKIDDQNIVIDALKQKLYHEQAYYSEDSNLFEQYRQRYNDIYFGDQGGNHVWSDYNKYLKQLVNKSNNLNERVYTEIPRTRQKKHSIDDRSRIHSGLYRKDDPNYEILDLRPNAQGRRRETQNKLTANNSTKISYNPEKYKSERLPPKDQGRTKLPRLVKIEGKSNEEPNIKNKVKQGLVKNVNRDDDFSLQSIHSGDSKVSGEIIQVEFHKK